MMFSKLLYLALGFIFVLAGVSAGYAVTYATNAFGYSDAQSYVTVDLTRHVESYTDYPNYNYNYSYNYYPNYYPGYSAYYYAGSYYYYPGPTNYYYVTQPVYTYTTYTVAPGYYNYYPHGWYYN